MKVKTTADWLKHNPKLPDGPPKDMALRFENFALLLADLPEGAEKATCLRKVLEAKDCAVRATLQFVD